MVKLNKALPTLLLTVGLSFAGSRLFYCSVEVENRSPLQKGFVTYYLARTIDDLLAESGWVKDCSKGKTVEVVVKELDYEGSSISENRFGGYTFSITFEVKLPHKTYTYSFSKYVSLDEPYLGTYPIREALADLLDTYGLEIKRDLLEYEREFSNSAGSENR